MLDQWIIDGNKVKIEPNSVFWGIGDEATLNENFIRVGENFRAEMNDFRFDTDIILFYVNPTDRCNASCPYCYLPREIKTRQEDMSYPRLKDLVEKVVDFFEEKGIRGTIVFHGSEPLMNKENILEIIDSYSDRINFGILTNGFLLSRKDADFVKKKGINMGISLDSPDERTNDFLRGEGHFKKVSRVLDWFKGYERLNVITTITRHNQGHLVDMVRFLHSKGVGVSLMNPVRGTREASRSFRPEPVELAGEFVKAVEESIRLSKLGKRIVIGDFANILLGIIAPTSRVLTCDISPCGAGRRFFAVTSDGSSYPCGEFIGMDEFMGGNIFSDSINGISSSENFQVVKKRAVEDIHDCDTCTLRNICGAPCPAEIYSTEGTMFKKSYYCDFYKRVIEHAFRVILRGDIWHVLRKSALKEKFNITDSGWS